VGYWLVKELLHKKPDLTWGAIMNLSSPDILEIVKNKKRA